MPAPRYPLFLGACAVALVTGCAQTGPIQPGQGARVEPVFRVQQPVGNVAGQYAIARVYLGEGRYDAAIARLREVLAIDPGFVAAHNALGVAYGNTGRFDLAAQAFREALASGPPAAHLLNNLGIALLKAGALDEAVESFRRSLDLDPDNEGTLANVRMLAEARREPLAARSEEEGAPVLQPSLAASSAPPPKPDSEPDPEPDSEPKPGVAPAGSALAVGLVPPAASPAPLLVGSTAAVPAPLPVPPAHIITALSQAQAARALGETPNATAYEIVTSRASEAALFEIASNVYELQHVGERGAVQPVAQPPRQSPRPTYAAAAPAAPVPRRVEPVDVVVTAIPTRSAELRPRDTGNDTLPVDASLVDKSAVDKSPVDVAAGGRSPMAGGGILPVAAPLRLGAAAWVPASPAIGARPGASPETGAPPGASLETGAPLAVAVRSGALRPLQASAQDLSLDAVDGLEVSNGVGVSRLAARTARQLEHLGANVARLTNHRGFGVQRTEIQYRDENLAAALAVQRVLPVQARLVPVMDLHPRAKVRLLVGQDLVDPPIDGLARDRHLLM